MWFHWRGGGNTIMSIPIHSLLHSESKSTIVYYKKMYETKFDYKNLILCHKLDC